MRFVFTLLLICTTTVACKKKEKQGPVANDPPTITITSQSVPVVSEYLCDALFDNVLKVSTGDTLSFSFLFRGSNQLSQYKIDAHNNFDCHEHGKSMEWSVLKLVDISGTELAVHEQLAIPENASVGNYHLMIRLLDSYGYEAEVKEFNVIITNPGDSTGPEISLSSPAQSSSFTVGSQVHFQGTITDNLSLEGGKFQLIFTDSQNTVYQLHEAFYPLGTTTSYTIDYHQEIGPFMAPGEGTFLLKAFDAANNVSSKELVITIVE